MALYIISYDLKDAEGHDYTDLHKVIVSFGEALHVLESTWIVNTSLTAHNMSDAIKKVYQPECHVIFKLTNADYWGRLKPGYWDWIKERL